MMGRPTTSELYEKMSFGSAVGFGRYPAALVIDFQKGLTLPAMPFYGWHDEQIIETTRVLAALRDKEYPVIFTVVAYDEAELVNDCYAFVQKIPAMRQLKVGSELAEVDERLSPRRDEFVLVKKFQSAFIGTPLSTILTGLGVDTLLVAGCATSGCVRGSVMDACALGYRVILIRECIGDFTQEVHDANMLDMRAKNADVADVGQVLMYIEGLASSGRSPTSQPVARVGA